MMTLDNLLKRTIVQIDITLVAYTLLQLAGRLTIRRIVRKSVKRAIDETSLDERKREDTIITIVSTTFTALVSIAAIIIILGLLGVNVEAIVTGAGLIGVIIGLSAQNTVKDLLAGMFILLEKQYRVGDVITLSGGSTGLVGVTGTVVEITLRITKLRALDGNHITVRNGEPTIIVNQTLSNASVVLDINVTYDSDINAVQKVMDNVGKELMNSKLWKDLIIDPIKFTRIDNFTDTGVVIRAVGTVSPASQWDVAGEYRLRILSAIEKLSNVKLAHT
jgi:small-conductance mechanosensitive channel